MKILVIEDDRALRTVLARALQIEGFEVTECGDGEEGLFYLAGNSCDAAVVDWMLPGLSGDEVVRRARQQGIETPVILLTALGSVDNRVRGLDSGADDYVVKPFEMAELLARVRAHTRRPAPIENIEALSFADICYTPASLLLQGPKADVTLTKKLGGMLELLLRAEGGVVNRRTIFARVWSMDSEVDESVIDSNVSFLRRRLRVAGSSLAVKAVYGVGFKLEEREG